MEASDLLDEFVAYRGRLLPRSNVRSRSCFVLHLTRPGQPCGIMQSAQDQCGDLPEDFDGVGWKNKWRFKFDTHSTGCVLSLTFLNRAPQESCSS
jgi:hypothetical protein